MGSRAPHDPSLLQDLPASKVSSFLRMLTMVSLAMTCKGGGRRWEGLNRCFRRK